MADIRIKDLPLATGGTAPTGTDAVAIDGLTTRKTTIATLGNVAVPIASQGEAETGTDASKRMTPLTVKQSIASEVGDTIASAAQGSLADSAVQPNDIGTAAYSESTDFATSVQGGKADTALQNDSTATPGDPTKFWNPNYFGNAATGIVRRMNRLLVGVAALTSSNRPATSTSWVETYFDIIVDSQLAAVSSLGSLAITGVSRTSDFRTWTGGDAGGAQGVSGFAVNDDNGGPSIAVGAYGEAIHKSGAQGISEAAEFTISSSEPAVKLWPSAPGPIGKATFAGNFSAGFRYASGYTQDVSAYWIFGANPGPVKALNGFVSYDGLSSTYGRGGRGVLGEIYEGQSLRWVNSANTIKAEVFGNSTGLHLYDNDVDIMGDWLSFATTISASSGTLTNASATMRYCKIGKTCHIRATGTITTNGTGSGVIILTLPFAAKSDMMFVGRASGFTGAIFGAVGGFSNTIGVIDRNDAYIGADGRTFYVNGTYEIL